jgi:hypothetical protein
MADMDQHELPPDPDLDDLPISQPDPPLFWSV